MKSASGVLSYLAECYRENGSRVGLTGLGSARVRQSLIVEGEDAVVSQACLDGLLYLPGKKAATLATQARLYEKECEMFYGSVFLSGSLDTAEGQKRSVFAPLILYSVQVEGISSDSGAEFSIDTNRRLLNYVLLECLGDDTFIGRFEQCVEKTAHTEGCVGDIRTLFEELFPDADTSGLLNFPRLLSARELDGFTSTESSRTDSSACPLRLLPAAALFLSDRSTEMRGVLNDMKAMAGSPHELSDPVRVLLGEAPIGVPGRIRPRGEIPAILSKAQDKIMASARTNCLTLVVGPPGTGKSFTIAALAMEAMSRGESVLIAAKMDHAVDVVADKIEQTLGFPGICVRAGRKGYLKDLKKFLEDLLAGLLTQEVVTLASVGVARKRLKEKKRAIDRAERIFARQGRREEKRGLFLRKKNPGLLTRWRIRRMTRGAAEQVSLNRFAAELSKLLNLRIGDTVGFLQLNRRYLLQKTLRRHRKTFQSFANGIRARTSHRQESYFKEVRWKALLEALPVWLVNLSDLHRVIPLERGLFDLVIIDEASQCDIASAMPALQRGKRAVVTGDPKQLRHLSFLSAARQAEFSERFGMTEDECERFHFRRVSLVDLVSGAIQNQDSVVFLNEHFRSRPGIIEFSNREFYAGSLAIMTGHREADHRREAPLSVFNTGGKRGGNGVNDEEINAILDQLKTLSETDEPPLSIGILSPFRAQVDAILSAVEKLPTVTRLLDRHQLLVGTAHSFQGEERDIVLLSLTLDNESPAASFRFLEKEDLFNVSITRARFENRIFVSFDPGRAPTNLVSRYLDHAAREEVSNQAGMNRVPPLTEPSRADLRSALEDRGFEVEEHLVLGGYPIDFLCRAKGRSLGIDLIGFPGPHAEAMGFERYLLLHRAWIRLFPLSLLEWQSKRDQLLLELDGWMQSPMP